MRLLWVAVCAIGLLFATTADAKPRHHHNHHHSYVKHKHVVYKHHRHRAYSVAYDRSNAPYASGRPADCYGIPWCGCWLRHQFGYAASSGLNLARNWLRFPAASPESANVVVWPGGRHVGKVLGCNGGQCSVISGNAGHNQIRTRNINANGGYHFRRV